MRYSRSGLRHQVFDQLTKQFETTTFDHVGQPGPRLVEGTRAEPVARRIRCVRALLERVHLPPTSDGERAKVHVDVDLAAP